MKRIHIVGCGPRSGTTLMHEMMIACFEIDLFMERERHITTLPCRPADIFLTKIPIDILIIKPILYLMKNLYVIYMLRDPRDMVVSKHASDPDRYWSSLKFWQIYTPYGLELQGHPRFIRVRYEELIREPDTVQADLMRRMPFLKKKMAFSCYHEAARPAASGMKAMGGVRPLTTVNIGNWRRHLPRIAGQLQRHGSISKDLIDYGYEPDAAWEKELEGVEADFSESHWPEYYTEDSLRRARKRRNLKAVWVVAGHSRLVIFVRRCYRVVREKLKML